MSRPQTPEPTLDGQGDTPVGSPDDVADGIQHSHRMLSFSDALLSIIATVMILPVTHTEISPEQVLGNGLQHWSSGGGPEAQATGSRLGSAWVHLAGGLGPGCLLRLLQSLLAPSWLVNEGGALRLSPEET